MFSGSEPILSIPVPESKVTALQWGPIDEMIVTGHENGKITQWDMTVNVYFKIFTFVITTDENLLILSYYFADWKAIEHN